MMDKDLFEVLIDKPEGRLIDYKALNYDFSTKDKAGDAKFVKDLISFGNTVRDTSAYIIFGIKEANGTKSLIGIDSFPDDSIFQQKAASKISPVPYFSAYTYNYDEKLFGVIEIPIHHYDKPLVSIVKGLKGIDVDKIYVRNGSSNSEATFSQIQELINWLDGIKSQRFLNSRDIEIATLIAEFSDNSIKLSTLFAKCYRLRKLINNGSFDIFVEGEIFGIKSGALNESNFYKYRLVRAPVTPYKITIQQFGSRNANQMIDYFFDHDKFREIDVLFSKSISEIETIIDDLGQRYAIFQLNELNENVFPGMITDVENATIYFGPQMMNNLYLKIRNKALALLRATIV